MIVLAIESSVENLEKLESCIQFNLPYAEIHGFVNGFAALDWAENNHVDIVFAQYTSKDDEMDVMEGAETADSLYAYGKCKNIILCGDSPSFSIDAWNSDASFFYLRPVSNKKIQMGLHKLRYPLDPIYIMRGRHGIIENHLTEHHHVHKQT